MGGDAPCHLGIADRGGGEIDRLPSACEDELLGIAALAGALPADDKNRPRHRLARSGRAAEASPGQRAEEQSDRRPHEDLRAERGKPELP
jgi:hypothetical protein